MAEAVQGIPLPPPPAGAGVSAPGWAKATPPSTHFTTLAGGCRDTCFGKICRP